MPIPSDATYREALAEARRLTNGYQAGAVQDIAKALDRSLKRMAAELAGLPVNTPDARRRALEASQAVVSEMRSNLQTALQTAIAQGRNVTFSEVLDIQQRASLKAARMADIPDALMGAVRTPSLTMLAAFAMYGRNGADAWRTVAADYVTGATEHVRQIFRAAIAQGVSPTHVAKWLYPYMMGVQDAAALGLPVPSAAAPGATVDLKKLAAMGAPGRKAANRIRFNADRLAYSELHNARREADATMYAADPLVAGVKWSLAAVRGDVDIPDECDGLAFSDFYGMGAGVYPVHAVPMPPHPFDRCDTFPVLRDIGEAHTPKPKPSRLGAPKWSFGRAQRNLAPDKLAALRDATLRHVDWSELRGAGLADIAAAGVGQVAPPPLVAAKPKARWETILHKKVGNQGGSNAGGFYVGDDGVERYVKFYANPAQAWNEHVAGQLYRDLGLAVPETEVFTTQDGATAFASVIVKNQGTVGKVGLNADRARRILEGYVADAFTANWDAVGMGLDNVVVDAAGGIVRIDNGGALLFRAQGGKFKTTVVTKDYLHSLADYTGIHKNNNDVKAVFAAAGYSGPLDPAFVQQVALSKMKEVQFWFEGTDWAAYVAKVAPGMPKADAEALVAMLNARTKALPDMVNALESVATVPAVVTAPPPPPIPANAPAVPKAPAAKKAPKGKAPKIGTSTKFPGFLTEAEAASWKSPDLPEMFVGSPHNVQGSYVATQFGDVSVFKQKTGIGSHVIATKDPGKSFKLVTNATADEVVVVPHGKDVQHYLGALVGKSPWSHTKAQITAAVKKSGKKLVQVSNPDGTAAYWLVLDQKAVKFVATVNTDTIAIAADGSVASYAKDVLAKKYGKKAKALGVPKATPAAPGAPGFGGGFAAPPKTYSALTEDEAFPLAMPRDADRLGRRYSRVSLNRFERVDVFGAPPNARSRFSDEQLALAPGNPLAVHPREAEKVTGNPLVQAMRDKYAKALSPAEARTMLDWGKTGTRGTEAFGIDNPLRKKLATMTQRSIDTTLRTSMGDQRAANAIAALNRALDQWYSSSNSEGGAIIKEMIRDLDDTLPSTYHGRYLDFRTELYEEQVQRQLREFLRATATTYEDLREAFRVTRAHHQAFVLHAIEGDVAVGLTMQRGVKPYFFEAIGAADFPDRDEVVVLMGNTMSSCTTSPQVARNFATERGHVFEWVAPVEDVQFIYFLNPLHNIPNGKGFWGEQEIFTRTVPRPVRVIPGVDAPRPRD